ncbi:hypothetical protein EVAR_35928_1 [Eumeta japonica]|uniref:Uncharacterized protein n=1 Tax=Eumeta variegata TaxID=151549 RepID=A0A4C1W3M9_EUMVA|nr:hypothetical protein EVAR_35928_1 [Eumeta japonica]
MNGIRTKVKFVKSNLVEYSQFIANSERAVSIALPVYGKAKGILRDSGGIVASLLYQLFNKCWKSHRVSNDWCKAVIVNVRRRLSNPCVFCIGLQEMVNKMKDSVKKRDIKLNVGKTKVMVFERGESRTECDILIEGEKVEQV